MEPPDSPTEPESLRAAPAPAPPPALVTATGVPIGDTAVAFQRHRDAILAVPLTAVPVTNVDIPAALVMVLGSLPRILPLRDEIVALTHTPASSIDDLASLAYAADHAHARLLTFDTTPDVTREIAELRTLRARFVSSARSLVSCELLGSEVLMPEGAPRKFIKLAEEMTVAARRLLLHIDVVEQNSPLRRRALERACELSLRVLTQLGRRPTLLDDGEDVALTRWKAFALVERAWDDVRRALTYLRWREGDVEAIAPSLRTTRARRRPKR